ncbi:HIRAN domain-containing protein [uncultured Catenibacterium sp.]|uniref:HIRAN domain-containing protein n=1 Tax=uncultured Catenibacterium sp. TaxID=286142 RepID=UPI00260037B8|nr:HIRAN domain-containing protein [uncultured Catenibacterium sp.]
MSKMRDMVLEAVKMNGIENVVMPLMNEIFLSSTKIAGTRYCDNQDVFKGLEKNVPLLLEREADNKYDSNAIKVMTTDREKLGYIPKSENSIYARLMDSGKILHARVYSCYEDDYYNWSVSIKIYMMDF